MSKAEKISQTHNLTVNLQMTNEAANALLRLDGKRAASDVSATICDALLLHDALSRAEETQIRLDAEQSLIRRGLSA